jgi:hypothetical protein
MRQGGDSRWQNRKCRSADHLSGNGRSRCFKEMIAARQFRRPDSDDEALRPLTLDSEYPEPDVGTLVACTNEL